MTLPERHYGVWLRELRIGTLIQRGDHTRFSLAESYVSNPTRPVLGLLFEQDLSARHSAALRLPCWFSNLLPEGRLRDWIAAERGVSVQREMELLAQVGHDLPGAVRVRAVDADESIDTDPWSAEPSEPSGSQASDARWRFSLAGVALKFSMLARHDRLTLPAAHERGDWIVKLPDRMYPAVPRNEYSMMRLAAAIGIDVPEVRLVHRDEVQGLPDGVWPDHEDWAYAVKRFDRTVSRGLVHIEDLAQVRNVYPLDKYRGTYETVGALLHRGHDVPSLREFARRLILNVLVSNGDAHLKNWSLIYHDERIPQLAPAYDLVSTRYYMGPDEDLGLRFGGTNRFDRIRLPMFERLERHLGVDVGLPDIGRLVIREAIAAWPEVSAPLKEHPQLCADVTASITERAGTLLGRQL